MTTAKKTTTNLSAKKAVTGKPVASKRVAVAPFTAVEPKNDDASQLSYWEMSIDGISLGKVPHGPGNKIVLETATHMESQFIKQLKPAISAAYSKAGVKGILALFEKAIATHKDISVAISSEKIGPFKRREVVGSRLAVAMVKTHIKKPAKKATQK